MTTTQIAYSEETLTQSNTVKRSDGTETKSVTTYSGKEGEEKDPKDVYLYFWTAHR
jgi:hypothetical protein